MIAGNIVDDIIVAGEPREIEKIQTGFEEQFNRCSVSHGPVALRFYGLNVSQDEGFNVNIDGNDKLEALEPYPLTRHSRRSQNDNLTALENSSFMSINSSLGWLGIPASQFGAFYSSFLQQQLPNVTVSSLTIQEKCLSHLKKLGTTISFPRPPIGETLKLSILVFADAGRTSDYGQLSTLSVVLV